MIMSKSQNPKDTGQSNRVIQSKNYKFSLRL